MEEFYNVFLNAFEYYTQKRYLDSLTKLNDAKDIVGDNCTPEFTTSLENLRGFNYLALNYTDYARECFEKSLALDSKSSQACAGLAELFFLEQKDKESKTMYEWAVKNNPGNNFAVNGLAKVNEVLGLPKEHNSLDEEVVEKVNENLRDIIFSVNDLFQSGKYSDAIKNINLAEKSVEIEIENHEELLTEMLNMKGMALLKLEEFEAARESFEKALQISPASSNACWGLAEIFCYQKSYSEAKTMYEWALKNNIENAAAAEGLSKVNKYFNLPEYHNKLLEDESSTIHQKVDETLVEAYDLFQNKDYDQSLLRLTQIEDSINHNNTDDMALILSSIKNFKGFNFLALNKPDEAKSHFEKALNLNPSSSQACAGLGEVLFIEGRDNEAKAMFEWAVKNDPQNVFGKCGLEKVNKALNFSENHNCLTPGLSLTLSSGKTVSYRGE